MKKTIISCIVFVIVYLIFLSISESSFVKSGIILKKFSNGIKESNINSILIDLKDTQIIYIATKGAIYISKDSGKYYKKVLSIKGNNSDVNFLFQDKNDPNIIYAATANGLYRSIDGAKSWQNIFKGKNNRQRYCKAVLTNQNKIYLATKAGLFFSFDNARTWRRLSGRLGNDEITSLASSNGEIYLACAEGIYLLSHDLKIQRKLYSVFIKEINENNELTNNSDYNEIKSLSKITDIKISHNDPKKIYFASNQGLFLSIDAGRTWQRFNHEGLLSKNIKTILLDSKANRIFVGTDRGIFEFYEDRWHQLYKGMLTNKINYLATDSSGNLWAATDRGVFKGSSVPARMNIERDEVDDILEAFNDEPSIQEIQKQAIKYAEVESGKITQWRNQARLAAFMPSLSLDYDKNIYGSASTKTSSDPLQYGTAMVGPRDWSLSLSWDLSELIWNPDQTSIDSRSKLMVELREDILDEVTRLYFERRRLQTELLISPPEEASERLDRVLRLEELTASIDALTGGYLSQQLENKSE